MLSEPKSTNESRRNQLSWHAASRSEVIEAALDGDKTLALQKAYLTAGFLRCTWRRRYAWIHSKRRVISKMQPMQFVWLYAYLRAHFSRGPSLACNQSTERGRVDSIWSRNRNFSILAFALRTWYYENAAYKATCDSTTRICRTTHFQAMLY
eukprot:486406-Pleurochrysis_carterae.AAC.4